MMSFFPVQKSLLRDDLLLSQDNASLESTFAFHSGNDLKRIALYKNPFEDSIIKGHQGLDLFRKIPDEIIVLIFKELDLTSLLRCSQVNLRFHSLAFSGSLWISVNFSKLNYDRVKVSGLKQVFLSRILPSCAKNIQRLDFRSCNLKSNFLNSALTSCINLKVLNLSSVECLDMSVFQTLSLYCSKLVELNLSNAAEVDDRSLELICENCSVLEVIHLSCVITKCHITDSGIAKIAQRSGATLQRIHLVGCENLTDDSIHAISSYCPQIQEIDVQGCFKITDQALAYLSQASTGLKSIDLSYCWRLTDWGLDNLPASLERLSLKFCYQLTNNASEYILLRGASLKVLDISFCNNITEEFGDTILNSRPDLSLISLAVEPVSFDRQVEYGDFAQFNT